ncbi:MAG: YitT family protein [Acetanaerobacterium sp.]
MENERRVKTIRLVRRIGGDIAGSFLYAVGVHCFTSAHNIAPGGATGIAIMLNYLTGLPIGILMLAINIPLLLLGWRFIGRTFTIHTLVSVGILTVIMDYVVVHMPVYTGNTLLASLFGGVVMGAGLAIVFMGGSTTGGTDIVTRLLLIKHPHLQMGRLVFMLDLVVISASILVFRSIDSALYAVIAMFTSARLIDAILYGLDTGKLVMVFTQKSDELAKRIILELHRGVTIIDGRGGYSGAPRDMILCAVRNSQYYKLKALACELDPKSFVIVTSASEIRGEGFKPIKEEG